MRIILSALLLVFLSGHSQNFIETNKIIVSKDRLFGVQSKNNRLIIDTIYSKLRVLDTRHKLVLPPTKTNQSVTHLDYYEVSTQTNEVGLIDANGNIIFKFIKGNHLVYDEFTKLVINSISTDNVRNAKFLYNRDGELVLKEAFKNIGFISNSPILVLIEKKNNREIGTLYNSATKQTINNISRFKIYNQDLSKLGYNDIDHTKFSNLNIITLIKAVDSDYLYGIIDTNGKELLPIEYNNLIPFTTDKKNQLLLKQVLFPKNVEFVFTANHISHPKQVIYFDTNFIKYKLETASDTKQPIFSRIEEY